MTSLILIDLSHECELLLSASVTAYITTPNPTANAITIFLQEIPKFLENLPPPLEEQNVFLSSSSYILARYESLISHNNQSALLPTTQFYKYVDGIVSAKLMAIFKYR